ncbi:hypothetical protein KW801_01625 [Candidatus Saccharibacteria bacterium]|nr:hypothetical protein [Candidatus Saccharibacteria bacterium]
MAKKTKKRTKNLKNNTSFSKGQFALFMLIFAVVGAFTLWVSFAAPRTGGSKGGKYSGSFVGTNPIMLSDKNSDGMPNFGDQITFNVSSTASQPWVRLDCYQSGTWVSGEWGAFYAGADWGKTFTLGPTSLWQNGAADCTASLDMYSTKGTWVTLATFNFRVNP